MLATALATGERPSSLKSSHSHPRGATPELEKHLAGLFSLERQIFEAMREGWIEGISLRYGALYGPGASDGQVEALRKRSLPLVAGGRIVMTWIYNEDAASAIVAALERGKGGEAYNIVDDEPVSWHDFLTTLAQAVGAPKPFSVPRWLLRPFAPFAEVILAETSIRASNAKAKRELGWTPSNAPTYREGVQKVAQALNPAAPRSESPAALSDRLRMRMYEGCKQERRIANVVSPGPVSTMATDAPMPEHTSLHPIRLRLSTPTALLTRGQFTRRRWKNLPRERPWGWLSARLIVSAGKNDDYRLTAGYLSHLEKACFLWYTSF
jgi:hypothetical protein